MTIAQRNRLIKVGIGITLFLTICSIVLAVFLIRTFHLESFADMATQIQHEIISKIPFCQPMQIVIIIQAIILPLAATIMLSLILFLFEKTQTIEISYFSVFAFMISIEAIRIFVPVFKLWSQPLLFAVLLSKVVLFSRVYALSAILIAALFTAHPFTRHSKSILFTMGVFAFSVTFAIPVNTSTWMTNFLLKPGFSNSDKIIFVLFAVIVFLAYYTRGKLAGIKEYVTAAWSSLLILIGYMLLLITAGILTTIIAISLFLAGVYYYLKAIHKYHLWQ